MTAQPSESAQPAEAELDPEVIRAWGRRSRERSGVPPTIEDPATIRRIRTLALSSGLPNGSTDRKGGGEAT